MIFIPHGDMYGRAGYRMVMWATSLLVLFLLCKDGVSAKPHFKFMTNYCYGTIYVNNSVLVSLTPPTVLHMNRKPDYLPCSLDLVAPKGKKLFVHFLQLSVSPDMNHNDRLKLFSLDEDGVKTPLTSARGLYGVLDRSFAAFDSQGSEITDYITNSNKLRFEYLGKPTHTHSGFRALVTAVLVPSAQVPCPSLSFQCPFKNFCIPKDDVCDGFPNCGDGDEADEGGCDEEELVTDLLDTYSLTYDILVIVILPVVIFLVAVLAFCFVARKLNRKWYPEPDPPAIKYSPHGEGMVHIEDAELQDPDFEQYAPPSYEDATKGHVDYNQPPSYSSYVILSGPSSSRAHRDTSRSPAERVRRLRYQDENNGALNGSLSSLDSDGGDPTRERCQILMSGSRQDVASGVFHRVHEPWHSDSEEDEEERKRRRKKGGKGGKCTSRSKQDRQGGGGECFRNTIRDPGFTDCEEVSSASTPCSTCSPAHSVPLSQSSASSFAATPSSGDAPSPSKTPSCISSSSVSSFSPREDSEKTKPIPSRVIPAPSTIADVTSASPLLADEDSKFSSSSPSSRDRVKPENKILRLSTQPLVETNSSSGVETDSNSSLSDHRWKRDEPDEDFDGKPSDEEDNDRGEKVALLESSNSDKEPGMIVPLGCDKPEEGEGSEGDLSKRETLRVKDDCITHSVSLV